MSTDKGKWAAFEKELFKRQKEFLALTEENNDAAKTVELDQTTVGRLSRMGAIQSQAMSIEAKARRQQNIQRIEEALKRLTEGTYGLCVVCHKDVALPRLEFDPAIPNCINCAV